MGNGRYGRLGSKKGAAPFRRGEKSSDLRVGTGTDGNPAIFANVGGKVYSTPLSLVNLGQETRAMNLDNLNIGNNVSFSNNGIKLDAPLKFVPSADTDINPPAGEVWSYIHKYPTVTGTIDTSTDTLAGSPSGSTGFTLGSSAFEGVGKLKGGIVTNLSQTYNSKNISVPITANSATYITHPSSTRVGGTLWANGDNFRVDGPIRLYFVYNCGTNNYYYSINLTTSISTLHASAEDVDGTDNTFLQGTSDAVSYRSGVTAGSSKGVNIVL